MKDLLFWLENLVSVSFLALGIATAATWLRTRDLKWGRLAVAIFLISVVQVAGWVTGLVGSAPPWVGTLQFLLLMASGFSFWLFRDSLIPLSPGRRKALTWVASAVVAIFLLSLALSAWNRWFAPLLTGSELAGFALWFGFSGEASIRFWRGSTRLPAVQRSRMRCLSAGIGGFVIDATISLLTQHGTNSLIHLGVHLAAFAVVGLIYVSYNPPRALRRVWREAELERYRSAMDELLVGGEPSEVVAGALAWAVRLVGGDGGIVASPAGDVLHVLGLSADEAETLGKAVGQAQPATMTIAGQGWIALRLPTDTAGRLLVVKAGTLTPLFASEEILLLQRYVTSVGVATERARLVKELADQQQEYAELLTNISDFGVGLIVSAGTQVTHVNDAFTRITGYRQGDLNGKSQGVMVATRNRHNVLAQPATPGGLRLTQVEMQVKTKKGATIDLETTAMDLSVDGIERTVGMIRDITSRKRTEKRLVESEERFRLLVSDVKDYAILNLDTDGRVTTWNSGAERLKGYTAKEIIGKHFSCFYTADDISAGKPSSELIEAERSGRVEDEGWRLRKDGTRFWANVVITALHDENGRLRGFGKVTRDSTERKRIDDEIRALNVELVGRVAERTAANQELEAFSYSVSHDLRAPLRAINGFVEALVEDHLAELSADAREYLGYVASNAKQMGRLIDDLLEFSRLSRQLPNRQRIHPAAIVKEVLGRLKDQFASRTIRVKIGKLPVCQADPRLLTQVYINLITNAVKFTRTREIAEIEVGHCRAAGESVYFVRDNGVGFDPAYQDKLFGVFQRLHRADEFEGTGVGLAIVQRVVNRHGGRVWAESRLGEGATFYFTLGDEQLGAD